MKQQTLGKMSDYKLLSPDKSGSGRDNVLLALKLISEEGGGANKNVLECNTGKIKSWGGGVVYSGLESKFLA